MQEQLINIKANLESNDALDVLRYLSDSGLKCAFSTSLGQEDQVLTHMIGSKQLAIDVFTLDTGRLFPQSYELMDRTMNRLGVPIKVYFPDAIELSELIENQGNNGFYNSVENRKECCRVRKIEPLKRALAGAEVWITGLRASQSANREELPIVEWDSTFSIIKVNPLVAWSFDQVIEYINKNKVPYNPLHDKGFISIGCAPCTRAIEPGEDIRAGRWWWESSKKECGLHQHK